MEYFSVAYLKDIGERYVQPLGINLLTALVVFFAGRWLARQLIRGASALMERGKVDISLRRFLTDVMYAALMVVILTASLDQIGVRTTAVVAIIGAAGLAIGLALQGSLANVAAGVLLIVLRPYKVGDLIVFQKYVGRVEAIKVFYTILITSDNREITVPNGQVMAGAIENLTVLGTRRVDIQVAVANGTDLHQVKQWLETIALSDRRVLTAPAPQIELTEIGPEFVKLYLRPWTSVEDYPFVAADTLERVRQALVENKVKFTALLDRGM
ncbi:MAG: mechanosensitive ion channel [Deltaproteobacteria bacterium]|nr:mechanosensitive ion channel [Deltaproteobacteria bacterium]